MVFETAISKYFVHKTGLYTGGLSDESYGDEMASARYLMTLIATSASKSSIQRFVITEKAPTRAPSGYYRFHI